MTPEHISADSRVLAEAKRAYHQWLAQKRRSKVTEDDDAPDSVVLFANRYVVARSISPVYAERLRKRSCALAKFALTARLSDVFTEDVINRFLTSLSRLSPPTVKSYRQDLLSMWNAAADLDLVPYARARRIKRIKCPELLIECFTLEEARAILEQAKKCYPYPMRSGISRRLYWPAVIMLAWDTGLRRGDCWAFKKSCIRPDGTARIVQRKTQQVLSVRLHPSTIAALNAIPLDPPCRWPGSVSNPTRFGIQFKAICRAAGVNRGSFKWLRRASGSYVEVQMPGAGSKHLGHSCPQMFTKHYDGKLGGHTLPQPPDLEGGAA
jgi:integrase